MTWSQALGVGPSVYLPLSEQRLSAHDIERLWALSRMSRSTFLTAGTQAGTVRSALSAMWALAAPEEYLATECELVRGLADQLWRGEERVGLERVGRERSRA
jgi:hypothetical protein